jgi:uncharacterized protein YlxW (UPF0749 family)
VRLGWERKRPSVWRSLVVFAAALAGLLFVTSAYTARGTDLRSTANRTRLADLIAAQQRSVDELDATAARLRKQVDLATGAAALENERLRELTRANAALGVPLGLSAVRGPGVRVTLDDAPRLAPGEHRQGDPTPDDLVVHEQDVLAVINALWAGGADAVTVMGERIIGTSAVRCVGNTLLLHGNVYSPPFVVAGIGDPARLDQALENSRGVQLFRSYVAAYGLGFEVEPADDMEMPAYEGALQLAHTEAVP